MDKRAILILDKKFLETLLNIEVTEFITFRGQKEIMGVVIKHPEGSTSKNSIDLPLAQLRAYMENGKMKMEIDVKPHPLKKE